MKAQFRNRYFFAIDIIGLAAAVYVSFVLRYDSLAIPAAHAGSSLTLFLILALGITPLVFLQQGIYSRYWPYASLDELLLLARSVAAATILMGLCAFVVGEVFASFPIIFFLLSLAFTATPRLAMRLLTRHRNRLTKHRRVVEQFLQSSLKDSPNGSPPPRLRILVVGAGEAGGMVIRECQQTPRLNIEVVGLLDDDETKHHLLIHGVPVLGSRYAIADIVEHYHIDQVVIAMPSVSGKEIRKIQEICNQVGVQTKAIPGLYELIDGKVDISQLRDVQIEDLLRRDPVRIDNTAVRNLLRGKRVLITGGGGSIGSELCRQVMRCEPSEIIVVGRGEGSVFAATQELQRLLAKSGNTTTTLNPVIADIRFPNRVRHIFTQYRPNIVFHAAAHKHVPLMEASPAEAIINNVLGTYNVLRAAEMANVERLVMISTDKAVHPTSIMGASKRVAELLVCQSALVTGRPYVAVRFGNVLGSRGSVVHTFKRQIAEGGPVTVTDPNMRRYFMTIPEAVQLVLQSAVLGNGGEIFTLDMGEQIKIADLARDMIRLSGLVVGQDIDLAFTGMRPGEKLYEELFMPEEKFHRTQHKKIFIAANASAMVPGDLEQWIETLAIAAEHDDRITIAEILDMLIPHHQIEQIDAYRPHFQRQCKRRVFPTTKEGLLEASVGE